MKNKTNIFVLLFSIATTSLMAQELLPLSLRQKEELKKQSWVRETPFEPVKVKDMGNRISALAINPANASHFVVASSRGGMAYPKRWGDLPRAMHYPALANDYCSGNELAVRYVGSGYSLRFIRFY